MAREIKFRAWDKADHPFYDGVTDSRRMCYFGPNYFLDDDGYLQITSPEGKGPIGDHDQSRFTELMQYTGLKDKNGVEIYEGDIVEFKNRLYGIGTHRDIVDLDVHTWLRNEDFGYDDDGLISPDTTKVIGNIYENPELLNG